MKSTRSISRQTFNLYETECGGNAQGGKEPREKTEKPVHDFDKREKDLMTHNSHLAWNS